MYKWGQENFCSCPKLWKLEFCVLRANFTDLSFGEELSMPPHGKVSKCVAIAIYVKNSLRSIPSCSAQSVSLFSRA